MKKYAIYFAVFCLAALVACQAKTDTAMAEEAPEAIAPVTVVSVSREPMQEFVELNATSSFMQRWVVTSNATGYLQGAKIQLNKKVSMGQVLFSIKTKEAAAIGNTINQLDPSFKFSGINLIRSVGTGYISELNRRAGDYVQDGEQLAVITDINSFAFILDLPYASSPYIDNQKNVKLVLPDGEQLEAFVSDRLPSMDSVLQTQRIILKVHASHLIPENLIAKVILIRKANNNARTLPKSAVLSDETQTDFWVMKMLNDSIAAKTAIKKGMETGEQIEVLEPVFADQDKIVLTGNFGLPDTAKVKAVQSLATP